MKMEDTKTRKIAMNWWNSLLLTERVIEMNNYGIESYRSSSSLTGREIELIWRKHTIDKVLMFPTKHKEGFISNEVEQLLKEYTDINMDKFNDALSGITAKVINKEIIYYHHDIEKALFCGIEGRDIQNHEFD